MILIWPTKMPLRQARAHAFVAGGCAIEHSLGKAWLETERVLTAGVARGITVRACERKAVTVQLWLPVASYTYTMIWQKEVVLLPSGGDGSIVVSRWRRDQRRPLGAALRQSSTRHRLRNYRGGV